MILRYTTLIKNPYSDCKEVRGAYNFIDRNEVPVNGMFQMFRRGVKFPVGRGGGYKFKEYAIITEKYRGGIKFEFSNCVSGNCLDRLICIL